MSKQTKEAKEAKHFDVDVKVRDFCSKSKVFFIIGLALILISLLSTFTGVNVALEFKGGTIITYSYVGDVDENSISKELTSLVGSAVKVQQGDSLDSDTKTLSLSFTSNDGLTIDRQNDVTNKVKELCPDNEVTLLDANDVNARSGGEFFAKCIVAAVFAALLLIIYIAFRFKQISGWSAGVCAVLGLLSTLIVTYGCVVLCRFEIDSNFMAVILTLLGYAVNVYLVNKTDKGLMFSVNDASINGYMCDPFWATSVAAGKAKNSSIEWSNSTLEENGIESIDEIELPVHVYYEDDWASGDLVNEVYTITPQ